MFFADRWRNLLANVLQFVVTCKTCDTLTRDQETVRVCNHVVVAQGHNNDISCT